MPLKLPLYMDHHATTPVAPEVFEAMRPYFTERFGNAASRNHPFGWEAETAVEAARAQIAQLIGCKPIELVFTSGATESDNLALKGVAQTHRDKGTHLITSQIEHHAVLDSCKRLEKEGFQVTYLPVNREGLVDPDDVSKALTPKTILVSIMLANNEIGTIQPLAEIGRMCKERGVLFHSDAVQAVGKIPVNVDALKLDLMSLTAHKLYGPKGVGALYVRMGKPRVRLAAQMDGGGHEKGRRSGTLNVPGIVGLGKACELAGQLMTAESTRLTALRERLWDRGSSGPRSSERPPDDPASGQPECELRVRRGRVAPDVSERGGRLIGVCLHVRLHGAELRPEGPGGGGGAGPYQHSLRPGSGQHGRGGGLRLRPAGGAGDSPSGDEPLVRDGPGRCGPQNGAVELALRPESSCTAPKFWITSNVRGIWGASPMPMAWGWWATRPAGTL